MSSPVSKPYLIGIAGPSCAGKTELTRRLARLLSSPQHADSARAGDPVSVAVLPLDCYYPDLSHLPPAERARHNFDQPTAFDYALFHAHLSALASGRPVERPVYDFATHTRTAQLEVIRPGRYLLVEGLFVLYWPPVRALLATKVFVDLDDRQCLERRIARDVAERGRTAESVIAQFNQTVRPMAEQFIRPTHQFADLIVRGDDSLDASVAAVMAHVDRHAARQASAHPLPQ